MRLKIIFSTAIACACVTLSGMLAAAQEKTGAGLAQSIAAIVDDQTFLVAHVDLDELDAGAALDRLGHILKLSDSYLAALSLSKMALVDTVSKLKKSGAQELFLVSSIADLPGVPYVLAVPVDAKTDTAPIVAQLGIPLLHGAQGAAHHRVGNLLLIGGSQAIERLKNIKPMPRPELAAACDAIAGSTAKLLLVPPADVRRIIEEILPNLPAQLGGGATRILTQGALWGAVGFDLSPKKMAARAVVQSADPAAAVALNAELCRILQAVGQSSEMQRLVPKYAEFAQAIKPTVSGDRLTLELNEANDGLSALSSLLAPPVEAARAAATRYRSTNNLKQIMLAMLNYSSANNRFPARASYSADGKPLLSWRVHILPYLEGRDGNALYKQFKLDEPWDSEHNRKLIDRMPDVLRSPLSTAGAGQTTYVVPVLVGGIFGGRESLEFKQIIDGTSNTIAVVEADDDHAVVWTKPDDIEIDVSDPAHGLRRATINGFLAGMADGSVRFLAADLGADILKPAFTAIGREPVRLP
jgi:hypothetical protein